MDPSTITTQPLRSSDVAEKPTEMTTVIDHNTENMKETPEKAMDGNLTEVTAIFDENDDAGMTEEKKRRKHQDTDCCCVAPYYSDDTDAFCLYILCRWMCECFAGIGRCTEDCFEGCAECLTSCCEGDSCCCADAADAGGDVAADGCGDCLTGCFECCTACDCDCST